MYSLRSSSVKPRSIGSSALLCTSSVSHLELPAVRGFRTVGFFFSDNKTHPAPGHRTHAAMGTTTTNNNTTSLIINPEIYRWCIYAHYIDSCIKVSQNSNNFLLHFLLLLDIRISDISDTFEGIPAEVYLEVYLEVRLPVFLLTAVLTGVWFPVFFDIRYIHETCFMEISIKPRTRYYCVPMHPCDGARACDIKRAETRQRLR